MTAQAKPVSSERLAGGRRIFLLALPWLILALVIVAIAAISWDLRQRPPWELSLKPLSDGVQVTIYKAGEQSATYAIILHGRSIPSEVTRIKREALPPELGQTTFYDETVRPGRWTLNVDGAEVDIMPARLVINGRTELQPSQ